MTPWVAFVVVERDDLAVAIHAEGELGEVVGAYGEAVEAFGEFIDQDHVVRDLAHRVHLQIVLAASQTEVGHRLQDEVCFGDSAHEWEHENDVGQAHLLAHASHRAALQREALGIGGMRVA